MKYAGEGSISKAAPSENTFSASCLHERLCRAREVRHEKQTVESGFECKPVVSFLQKNLSQGNKKLLQDKLKNSLTHNNISVTPHGVLNRIVLKTYITDSQTANTGAVGKRASRECIGKVLHAGSSAGVVIRIG